MNGIGLVDELVIWVLENVFWRLDVSESGISRVPHALGELGGILAAWWPSEADSYPLNGPFSAEATFYLA